MKQASFKIDKKNNNNINKTVSNNAVFETPNSFTKEEPNKNLHNNQRNTNFVTSNKPRKHVENIYYF
jgi:hypothetical protein